MKIYLSHSSGHDYETELYQPLRQLSVAHDIYFPHDEQNKGGESKEAITSSDLVLAEVSHPSTGQGIELGWASAQDIPIVCFHRTGSKVSSALQFISSGFIEYESTQDMVDKIASNLEEAQLSQ